MSALSRTMPRSTTRAAWPSSRAVSTGTSGPSASWRSRSISRRIARTRSPSWPPNDSATMPDQSSSPEAQRKTEGMKPGCTPTGTPRRRARWAWNTVSAAPASRSRRCLSLGRFLRNARAIIGSPERDSSSSVEGGAAVGDALLQPLEVARGVLAARGGAPRAAVTLDGGHRRLRPLLALARDEVRDGQALELLGEVTQAAGLAAAQVARHVQRRRGPEDALHEAALEPDEREPPRLGLRRGALAAPAAPAHRLPAGLDLLARPPVATDTSKVAAR